MIKNDSNDSQRRLQKAMDRLLNGKARYCDGRLTKTNLAREAGVSQATMYRTKSVLAEWDQRVSDSMPRNAQVTRLETELLKSRKRMRELEQQNTALRRQITAAATAIAELAARLEQAPQGQLVSFPRIRPEDVSDLSGKQR